MADLPAAPGRVRAGPGVRLWDTRGREYLDFLGGIAVVAAGHAHPRVVEAVSAQLGTLGHTSNLYFTGPQVELAERLVGLFGGDAKVFLSNSGPRPTRPRSRWPGAGGGPTGGAGHRDRRHPGRVPRRTLATLAATGKPEMHTPFQPLPPGFSHVPFGDVDAMAAAIGPDTAAVLVEPIQGEAGIRVPPPGYLRAVRELTRRAGVLLIVDEIQSGMGRTGRFFAHQHEEIRPDVVTMAKALGSGYPIGATIARTEVADAMQRGDHGTTFGGNPVACTAALATLDVIEPLLGGHVDKVSTRLADGLEELRGGSPGGPPGRRRVGTPLRRRAAGGRGSGGRAVVRARPGTGGAGRCPAAALAALGRGLVVNPVTGTALRLAPPLVVTEEEIDEGLRRLGAALEEAGLCR